MSNFFYNLLTVHPWWGIMLGFVVLYAPLLLTFIERIPAVQAFGKTFPVLSAIGGAFTVVGITMYYYTVGVVTILFMMACFVSAMGPTLKNLLF